MSIPPLNKSLAWIGFLTLAAPLVPAPVDDPRWHGLRTLSVEAGMVPLLLLLFFHSWNAPRRKSWADALKTLPFRFLAALAAWGCLSALLSPTKSFACQGLLQLSLGALIVLTVASEARERPQQEILLDALTGATLLISFSGFALYGSGHLPLAIGLYHDHDLFGAVFTILLPLMLAVSLSPTGDTRRLFAQAAFLGGLLALGMAQTRSSWIGAGVGLFVFLWLFFSCRSLLLAPF